jgi:hypothetical protein
VSRFNCNPLPTYRFITNQNSTWYSKLRGFIALLTFGICCRSVLRSSCHPSQTETATADTTTLLNWTYYSTLLGKPANGQLPKSLPYLTVIVAFFFFLVACIFCCLVILFHSRIHCFTDLRHLLSVGFAIFLPPKATATATADTTTLLNWTYYSTPLGKPANHHPYTQLTSNSTHKPRIHCFTDLRHLLSVGFAI